MEELAKDAFLIKPLEAVFIRRRKFVISVATLGGLVSGPAALRSARASNPPLNWDSLGILFIGPIIGLIFVLGIQAVLRKPKAVRVGWYIFHCCNFLYLSSGIASLAVALWQHSFGPPAVLFLDISTAIFLALLAVRSIFRKAFEENSRLKGD